MRLSENSWLLTQNSQCQRMTSYWYKTSKVKVDKVRAKMTNYWRNICSHEAAPGDAKTPPKKNRSAPLNELHKFRGGPESEVRERIRIPFPYFGLWFKLLLRKHIELGHKCEA